MHDQQHQVGPSRSGEDNFKLISKFGKVRGLVRNHLTSFNNFLEVGIKKIILKDDLITSDVDPSVTLRFLNAWVDIPSKTTDGVTLKLDPQTCRISDLTYAAPVKVDVEFTYVDLKPSKTEKKIIKRKDITIARLPIMVKSNGCVLHDLDDKKLQQMGECPLDPGGYFIVKGTERVKFYFYRPFQYDGRVYAKVILIQEQLAMNRIYVDTNENGKINASIVSIREKVKSKTVIQMDNGLFYLTIDNFFKEKIPIMVVIRAMDIGTDKVHQTVGRDRCYFDLLEGSFLECKALGILSKRQALKYLEQKVNKCSSSKEVVGVMPILRDVFLAHIPMEHDNFEEKFRHFALMLRRILDVILGKQAVDDKDYIGNKRYQLSGQLISMIFEDLFKTLKNEAKKTVDVLLRRKKRGIIDFSAWIKRLYNGWT